MSPPLTRRYVGRTKSKNYKKARLWRGDMCQVLEDYTIIYKIKVFKNYKRSLTIKEISAFAESKHDRTLRKKTNQKRHSNG